MKNLLILVLALTCFSLQAQKKSAKGMEETTLTGKKQKKTSTFKSASDIIAEKEVEVNDFEGKITIKDSRGIGLTGEFLLKGYLVAGAKPYKEDQLFKSIIDNKSGIVIELNEKEKVAVKSRRIAHNRGYLPPAADGSVISKPSVTVTKETKSISGYTCTKVIANDGYSKVEAWVAPKLKFSLQGLMVSASGMHLMELIRREGMKGMIMKMSSYDLVSGESFNITVKAESKKVKDKSFKIPKGYKILDHTNIVGKSRPAPSVSSFGSIREKAFAAQKKMQEGGASGTKGKEGEKAAPAEKVAPVKEKE